MKFFISEKTGSVFWMERDALFYSPMPQNDLVDTEHAGGEVDWELMKGEKMQNGELYTDHYAEVCKTLTEE